MSSCRVVVVSDSHLSERTPEAQRNWSAVLRHLELVPSDLVVHAGDLSLDGSHDSSELIQARNHLDRVTDPWFAVPGNHDIGDNPGAGGDPDEVITSERLAIWRDEVGDDFWATAVGSWRIVGVNAQLFGSDSDAEAEQWAFLEVELADSRVPTVLVVHKPLTASDDELASAPGYRFVPSPARERVVSLCHQAGVEVVVSGHVHQSRRLHAAAMTHLWAPTTWAVLPDWLQPHIGAKRCGILELDLRDDGGFTAQWVEPYGLEQLTLGEDIASPYEPEAESTHPQGE
jgi:3',5'-cyclic AMP phosphodiesterase CpdA